MLKVIDHVLSSEQARFERSFKRFARLVDKDVASTMRAEARLFGVDLAFATTPYGKNATSYQRGLKAVRKDIGKVFANPSKVFAEIDRSSQAASKAFYGLLVNGNVNEAREILRRVGGRFKGLPISPLSPEIHQRRRVDGKVDHFRPAVVLENSKSRVVYTKQVEKRVGMAKASWVVDLQKLGGLRGVPGWVSKARKSGTGYIVDKTRGNSPLKGVEFVSMIPYISKNIRSNSVRVALGRRAKMLMRKVDQINQKRKNNL